MKPKRETIRHREAFEYYWSMGADRTLTAVAEKFGVSETAAKGWSVAFEWRDKVNLRDNKVADVISNKNINEAVKARRQLVVLARASLAQYARELKAGNIKFVASDLERLGSLLLLLVGEAEKPENSREFKTNMRELAKSLVESIEETPRNKPFLDHVRRHYAVEVRDNRVGGEGGERGAVGAADAEGPVAGSA